MTNLQVILGDLTSADVATRLAAAEHLARLGAEARPAALALVQALGDADDESREQIASTLEDLGPPPVAQVEPLAAFLADEREDVAYWAATLLGRLDTEAAPAVAKLAAALATHRSQSVRERCAWTLGQVGPGASAARKPLENALAGGGQRLQRLAREALDKIAG